MEKNECKWFQGFPMKFVFDRGVLDKEGCIIRDLPRESTCSSCIEPQTH